MSELSLPRFVRPREAARVMGVSRTTVWRLRRQRDDFPEPVRLSHKVVAWPVEQLEAWMVTRPTVTRDATAK